MKRNESKQQEQKNQTQHKDQPVIRVQSGLRAGAVGGSLRGCRPDI